MVLKQIEISRKTLNMQIERNDTYENILKTSCELDSLISEYYNTFFISWRKVAQ